MAQKVKKIHLSIQETQETQVQSLSQEDPLEWEMATHSTDSCLESFMDWRSLAGYSPWGSKESDMTEHAHILYDQKLTNTIM